MKELQKSDVPARKRIDNEQRADCEPDWEHACTSCGERPVVPATGLCGACTFGEADTAGGNW